MPTPKPDVRRIKKMIYYRKKLKLSYRETCRLMGISIRTIQRWEAYLDGTLKVSPKNVRKLSTVKVLDSKFK